MELGDTVNALGGSHQGKTKTFLGRTPKRVTVLLTGSVKPVHLKPEFVKSSRTKIAPSPQKQTGRCQNSLRGAGSGHVASLRDGIVEIEPHERVFVTPPSIVRSAGDSPARSRVSPVGNEDLMSNVWSESMKNIHSVNSCPLDGCCETRNSVHPIDVVLADLKEGDRVLVIGGTYQGEDRATFVRLTSKKVVVLLPSSGKQVYLNQESVKPHPSHQPSSQGRNRDATLIPTKTTPDASENKKTVNPIEVGLADLKEGDRVLVIGGKYQGEDRATFVRLTSEKVAVLLPNSQKVVYLKRANVKPHTSQPPSGQGTIRDTPLIPAKATALSVLNNTVTPPNIIEDDCADSHRETKKIVHVFSQSTNFESICFKCCSQMVRLGYHYMETSRTQSKSKSRVMSTATTMSKFESIHFPSFFAERRQQRFIFRRERKDSMQCLAHSAESPMVASETKNSVYPINAALADLNEGDRVRVIGGTYQGEDRATFVRLTSQKVAVLLPNLQKPVYLNKEFVKPDGRQPPVIQGMICGASPIPKKTNALTVHNNTLTQRNALEHDGKMCDRKTKKIDLSGEHRHADHDQPPSPSWKKFIGGKRVDWSIDQGCQSGSSSSFVVTLADVMYSKKCTIGVVCLLDPNSKVILR